VLTVAPASKLCLGSKLLTSPGLPVWSINGSEKPQRKSRRFTVKGVLFMVCLDCGEPVTRTLAAESFCESCADQVLARIEARRRARLGGIGSGHVVVPRPDWGSTWGDLVCDECGAGWTGPALESCAYCLRREQRSRDEQRALLLMPDLPLCGDARRSNAVDAWGDRLAAAAESELLTEQEADVAYERETRNHK
jgi:hypothetical protein